MVEFFTGNWHRFLQFANSPAQQDAVIGDLSRHLENLSSQCDPFLPQRRSWILFRKDGDRMESKLSILMKSRLTTPTIDNFQSIELRENQRSLRVLDYYAKWKDSQSMLQMRSGRYFHHKSWPRSRVLSYEWLETLSACQSHREENFSISSTTTLYHLDATTGIAV
jgi:hypothetical protein